MFRPKHLPYKTNAMKRILIRDANIVNEGKIIRGDVYIKEGLIYSVGGDLSGKDADIVIDAKGKYLLPGLIDDQVHFREPGLTHKAEIYTESKQQWQGCDQLYGNAKYHPSKHHP